METIKKLLTGLTDEEKKLLEYTHTCNRYIKRGILIKQRISLINDLIGLILFYKQQKGIVKVKLFVPDLILYTGIGTTKKLQPMLRRINTVWESNNLATIRYDSGYIYFELFSNEMAA